MEAELHAARQQLSELSRLKRAKEARESECMRLRGEIQSLKATMVTSARQLKEESSKYRRWRLDKENEVRFIFVQFFVHSSPQLGGKGWVVERQLFGFLIACAYPYEESDSAQ